MDITRGPSFNPSGKSLGLGSLINPIRVLTNYILPFQKIGNSELFETELISWRLGEHSGGRIKSFARRRDLLLSLCFIISCWAVEDGRLWRVDARTVSPLRSDISFYFKMQILWPCNLVCEKIHLDLTCRLTQSSFLYLRRLFWVPKHNFENVTLKCIDIFLHPYCSINLYQYFPTSHGLSYSDCTNWIRGCGFDDFRSSSAFHSGVVQPRLRQTNVLLTA